MTSAEELVTPFNRLALADHPLASATPAFSSEETGSSMGRSQDIVIFVFAQGRPQPLSDELWKSVSAYLRLEEM